MRRNLKLALAISSVIALFFSGALLANAAANDSDQSLHFWQDAGAGPVYADQATVFGWNTNVIGSNSTTAYDSAFSCPAASTGVYVFVTKRGTERNGVGSYYAFIQSSFNPGTTQVLTPLLKLSGLTNGPKRSELPYLDPNTDPLSLGISCTSNDGVTTLWASYRYISFTNILSKTWTAEAAPTGTQSPTPSGTSTPTPTGTQTSTPTPTPTNTQTSTPTPTPSESLVPITPAAAPSWVNSATIYHVNVRNFSAAGSLQAFRDQVPRLKKLGVKVIDFTPLTPISAGSKHLGTLGSPYSVDDYQSFNTDLGTGTEFRYLVDYLHSQGMKVVVGWNAQSTGWEHAWVTAHPDWYVQVSGAIISPAGADNTDKALLDYNNASMRSAMITAFKYWVTTYGVDGFDCVFASQVPADFWDRAAANVNAIKTGLLWMSDNDGRADLKLNSFNIGSGETMNARLGNLRGGSLKVAQFAELVNSLPVTTDTSWTSSNYLTNDFTNAAYGSEAKFYGAKANAFGALTFALPGTPSIFYGQEVGSAKKLPLADKGFVAWPKTSATQTVYQKLISLRAKNSALWTGTTAGSIRTIQTGNANVLGFERTNASNRVIVLINLGAKTVKNAKAILSTAGGKLFDLATGKQQNIASTVKFTLTSGGFKILSSN